MRARCIGVILLLIAASATAQQSPGDLSGYLPASGKVTGLNLSDAPQNYRGDDLYLMIDGGADIYYEYGFTQVLRADYTDARGKSIKLEIYEMESPAAAYGIYTFKVGAGGRALAIGQEALIEDYYLNFWTGNLLVTVVGQDPEEETVKSIIALGKAVDDCAPKTGARPALTGLLLKEPFALSRPKYVRGPLGVMNSYIFDTQNIFGVREGVIGEIGGCQAFVFGYADEAESARAYEQATNRFSSSSKFTRQARQGNQYSMAGREKEFVLINQTARYITIVIGQDQDRVNSISNQLIDKLKRG